MAVMNRAMKWLIPGGVLLAVSLIVVVGWGPVAFVEEAGGVLSWIVCGSAAALAVLFQRSRVMAVALGLLAIDLTASSQAVGFTGLYFFSGLLAVLVAVLAFTKDRGVFSPSGLIQVGAVITLGMVGALLLSVAPGDVAGLLAAMPLPARAALWSGLPQPVFLVFGVALAATLLLSIVRNGPVERGLFWFLLTVGAGLYFSTEAGSMGLLFLAAGLTLGFSVLETSYAMAYRDDLTGLPSRRALMRDLETLRGTYSVAMVDVDHFKRFNDKFGHDVGDQVLRMVASRLGKAPGGGRAYRYGGEEFTLLFAGKNLQASQRHLQEVRKAVQDAVFILRGWRRPRTKPVDPGAWKSGDRPAKRLSVTVSIGVAESAGKEGSPGVVLRRADQALYRAKAAGRNRVAK